MILMLLLAATLQEPSHEFRPPNPDWSVKEDWLRPPPAKPLDENGMIRFRPDGLVYVGPQARAAKDVWKELRYFDGKQIAKTRLYDPQGRLQMEIDASGDDQYVRILQTDGKTGSYQHSRKGRLWDGYSGPMRIVEGSGELIWPSISPGAWTHFRLHDGLTYMAKEYKDSVCASMTLQINGALFSSSPGKEALSLWEEAESWNREVGQVPTVTIDDWCINFDDGTLYRREVPPKTDIRRLSRDWSGRREAHEIRDREIRAEWALAYPKRRATFLQRYSDFLKTIDAPWSALGIDFIRDDTPWFPAGTTNFPRLGGRRVELYRCTVDPSTGIVDVDHPPGNTLELKGVGLQVACKGHTFSVVMEDNRKIRKIPEGEVGIPGFPDRVRVSIEEVDDATRKVVRSIPVQEFRGEHEKHTPRALTLKDGVIGFYMEFWTND